MTHQLKCWPEYYSMIAEGIKTFDLRKNDRGFKVGQQIQFEEWSPNLKEYSGRVTQRRIVYILENFTGLLPGYCILGLESVP